MRIDKEDPILIIGGGLSGLVTAVALQQYEFINVKIFDKEPEFKPNTAAVNLGAHAFAALHDIHMAELVNDIGTPWERLEMRWKDGKTLKEIKLDAIKEATNFLPASVPGETLYQLLLRELPKDWLITDETFLSYTVLKDGVEAHFESGNSEMAKILIGADGLHSRVRLQMQGRTPVRAANRIALHSIIPTASIKDFAGELLDQPYLDFLGPESQFGIAPLPKDQTAIWVTTQLPEQGITQEGALTGFLMAAFKDWVNPISLILGAVPEERWMRYILQDREPVSQFHQGNVTLVGDAIHPALPYLGMGTGMSIESGVLLARTLSENLKRIDKGLKTYEKKRAKRTKLFNQTAQKYAGTMAVDNPIAYTLRNAIYQHLPDAMTIKPFYTLNKGNYYD